MYISEFWVGVFATLGAEFIALIIFPLIAAIIRGLVQSGGEDEK